MGNIKCKWLPPINAWNNKNEWIEYQEELYEIFKATIRDAKLKFNGKDIKIKIAPKFGEYETAFVHLFCKTETANPKDPNDREPDLRRAERLHWIKEIIQHYPCLEECVECEGLLLYEKYYHNRVRVKIFFPNERYIIVLEDRKNYYLLITAFYIEPSYSEKTIKNIYSEYELYKRQGTPVI